MLRVIVGYGPREGLPCVHESLFGGVGFDLEADVTAGPVYAFSVVDLNGTPG